jgi:hypothetical protein
MVLIIASLWFGTHRDDEKGLRFRENAAQLPPTSTKTLANTCLLLLVINHLVQLVLVRPVRPSPHRIRAAVHQ